MAAWQVVKESIVFARQIDKRRVKLLKDGILHNLRAIAHYGHYGKGALKVSGILQDLLEAEEPIFRSQYANSSRLKKKLKNYKKRV